jgi:hypothetical protein
MDRLAEHIVDSRSMVDCLGEERMLVDHIPVADTFLVGRKIG